MALTEAEIIDRHRQSLGEARDHCQWLATQQDHENAAPRGRRYAKLREALNNLEGSCRQMAHFRGDARWLKLGVLYARMMPAVQKKYIGQRWAFFALIVPTLDHGMRVVDQIATRKTGVRGDILPESALLPGSASDWIIMPEWHPHGGMTAQGRTH